MNASVKCIFTKSKEKLKLGCNEKVASWEENKENGKYDTSLEGLKRKMRN